MPFIRDPEALRRQGALSLAEGIHTHFNVQGTLGRLRQGIDPSTVGADLGRDLQSILHTLELATEEVNILREALKHRQHAVQRGPHQQALQEARSRIASLERALTDAHQAKAAAEQRAAYLERQVEHLQETLAEQRLLIARQQARLDAFSG
ncbi:MAG: hypothetical protein D6755_00060 [Anaerolineae bacterium]|nr:MAG: hypothetical protein D6755_00060 [Anaerolineae bacterium]